MHARVFLEACSSKPFLILLKRAVKIITSCSIITAPLFQVELKSGRINSQKNLLIGQISFKIYTALLRITNSVNFAFVFCIE